MNEEKLDFLGITRFHNAGYFGQGMTIADREGTKSKHGAMVEEVIKTIIPEANVLLKQEYTKSFHADVYTTSLFYSTDLFASNSNKARDLYEQGTFLCCAVGNDGESGQTTLSKFPWWCSIGACDLVKGQPKRMYYSSITEDIDFCSFTNMKTSHGVFTGTSCATPVFASMCILVQQFFKKMCGRKLTNSELLNFIQDNTLDIGEEGFDTKAGNGVFILPEPQSIDVNKYIGAEKIIRLKIGSALASINNEVVTLDAVPKIEDNRTLVPLRFIAEALNCEVIWDNENREIYIIKEGDKCQEN